MIRLLDHWSQWALEAHLIRHLEENDTDHFMASVPATVALASMDPTLWTSSPVGGAWQRVWGYRLDHGIYAHVSVTGNPLASHRCSLAMGVEREFRGQGIGRQLMTTALDWVRAQPSLAWIDGSALESNTPVLSLDKSVGFQVVGNIPDVVRFDGHSTAQLQLVLRVR